MSGSPSKIVSRLDLWINPVFDELIEATPTLQLQRLFRADEDGVWDGLSRSAAYYVTAAKDELPLQWFANEALIERCPNLLCVSSGGAGYDTVDVAACTRAGIAVVNQAGANADSVAEHTFGLLLALAKRIIPSNRRLRQERSFAREELMGDEVHGTTLGIIGLGVIGERTANLARGFGMNVLAYDPYLDEDTFLERGAQPATLERLLGESDYISVHCPLNASTHHLMGPQQFAAMKKGAVFLTTARGGIHDEAALYDALKNGHLSGAGLDVWAVEPPPLSSPLLALENVIATYHTAGVSVGGAATSHAHPPSRSKPCCVANGPLICSMPRSGSISWSGCEKPRKPYDGGHLQVPVRGISVAAHGQSRQTETMANQIDHCAKRVSFNTGLELDPGFMSAIIHDHTKAVSGAWQYQLLLGQVASMMLGRPNHFDSSTSLIKAPPREVFPDRAKCLAHEG